MYKIKFHKLNDSLKHYGRKGMKWGKNIFDTLTGKQNNYKFGFEGNRWAGANPPSHIKVIEPSPQSAKQTSNNNLRSKAKILAATARAKKDARQFLKNYNYMNKTRFKQLMKDQKEKAPAKESANRPSNVNVNVTDKVENGVTLNSVTNGIGNHDMYSYMARTDAKDPEYTAWDRKQTKKAYPSDWKPNAFREVQNRNKVIKKFAKLTANSASRHQDLNYDKLYDQAQRSDKEIAYQKYLKKHHPEKAKQRISNKR